MNERKVFVMFLLVTTFLMNLYNLFPLILGMCKDRYRVKYICSFHKADLGGFSTFSFKYIHTFVYLSYVFYNSFNFFLQ